MRLWTFADGLSRLLAVDRLGESAREGLPIACFICTLSSTEDAAANKARVSAVCRRALSPLAGWGKEADVRCSALLDSFLVLSWRLMRPSSPFHWVPSRSRLPTPALLC